MYQADPIPDKISSSTLKPAWFSVVVPALNEEANIESFLQSLYDESYRPIEVIIVDDCSTDSTRSRVELFASRNSGPNFRVQLVELDSHRGPSYARNRGIERSTGQFLLFVDADMLFMEREIISALAASLETFEIVGFRDVVIQDTGLEMNLMLDARNPPFATAAKWSHLAFRRSAFTLAYDEQLGVGEDIDLFARLRSKTENIPVIANKGGIHLAHSNTEYLAQTLWQGRTSVSFLLKHPERTLSIAARMGPAVLLVGFPLFLLLSPIVGVVLISVWLLLIGYHLAKSQIRTSARVKHLFYRFSVGPFAFSIGFVSGVIEYARYRQIHPGRRH